MTNMTLVIIDIKIFRLLLDSQKTTDFTSLNLNHPMNNSKIAQKWKKIQLELLRNKFVATK